MFSTLNFTEHVHSASISQMQNMSQSLERDILVNQKLALELVRARAYLRATRDALHEKSREKLIDAAEKYKTKDSVDFYFVLDMDGTVDGEVVNYEKHGGGGFHYDYVTMRNSGDYCDKISSFQSC
jgi:hypothetical protein